MRIHNSIYLITLVIFISGCSSPGTIQPSQLTNAAQINETHCYNMEIDIIEKRISQYLKECFTNRRLSSYSMKIGNIPKGKRISLKNGDAYQYSAELRSNEKGCKTESKMYGINQDWLDTLYQSNNAAYGNAYKCH